MSINAIFRAILLIFLYFLFFPNIANAKVVTSVQVQSTASQSQIAVPVTFGQVFKPGDVATGRTLVASIDGNSIPLQVDKKALNADGSLRHAVLTAMIPSLGADSTKAVELSTASAASGGASASLKDLLDSGFDAQVVLDTADGAYKISARQLLQKAASGAGCSPWGAQCATWLSGPLATEWQVWGPLHNDSGEAHPHLSARFYVRYYPAAGKVRLEVIVENDWAFVSNPHNIKYDAHILIDGSEVYSKSDLSHTDHTRWRKVFWVGGDPDVYVKHDLAYLKATGAIPNYDPSLSVPESAISGLYHQFLSSDTGPMGISFVANPMHQVGGRPDIGPLPKWTALRLLSMDPRLIQVDDDIGSLAGSWPVHLRDKSTGRPVSLEDHPNLSTHPAYLGSSSNPLPAASYGEYPSNVLPDWNHEPSMDFVPYLLTGDYYYLEELQFWAAWNPLRTTPSYRDYDKGLFKWTQVRGQAWSLRTLGQIAYITPDSAPMKQYWKRQLENNLTWYDQHYPDNSGANKLGFLVGLMPYNNHRGLAPWQDDFFTWAMGYLVNLGFENARPMLDYKARFPVGRMTAPGYCWALGAIYTLNVRDSSGSPFYDTFAKAYAESASKSYQDAECGSAKMASLMGSGYKTGDMSGYPWSPQGFPSNMQPALAAAVDAGVSNAKEAWAIFMNRTTKPDYSSYPNWDIVPRGQSSNQPFITFYADPNPAKKGQKTTLHWQAYNAGSCQAPWTGQAGASGTVEVGPVQNGKKYVLECTGTKGSADATVILHTMDAYDLKPNSPSNVSPPPSGSISGTSQGNSSSDGTSVSGNTSGGGGGGGAIGWFAFAWLGLIWLCRYRCRRAV